MIDFEKLAVAMGELDEDTVKEILEAIDNPADADKAMEACQKIRQYELHGLRHWSRTGLCHHGSLQRRYDGNHLCLRSPPG